MALKTFTRTFMLQSLKIFFVIYLFKNQYYLITSTIN